MRSRTVMACGLVIVGLVTAACSSGDNSPPRQAVGTTSTSGPTTSTTASTPTSAPAEERAEVAVVRLLRLRNEAFSNPDPARADAYLAPDCACYAQDRSSLANLQTRGWRWESPMFEVLGVKVAGGKDPKLVTLTVVTRRPPERVVDASGALAKPEGPGEDATGYSYLLVRKDGSWRIGDNFRLDLAPEVIRQVIAGGMPA